MRCLKPDFEFEKLFPSKDPDITFYESHLESFGYDNDFLSIVFEHAPLFDQDFLNQVNHATEVIKSIDGVQKLHSPLNLMEPISGPMGILYIPLIHLDQREKLAADSARIFSHPFYTSLFGKDQNSLIINVTHDHFTTPEHGDAFISSIEKIITEHQLKARLVGKLTAQKAFIDLIGKDFGLFIVTGLILSLILLRIILKSWKSTLIPYVISLTALIWLMGLMGFLGIQLTILSSLIPPIILFASTADAIHLINAFNRQKGTSSERIDGALSQVFLPTLLTSLTTAIGFFSLYTIGTVPVQEMGIFAGIGVLMAFFITLLVGPIMLFSQESAETKTADYKLYVIWLLRNQKTVVVLTLFLLAIGLFGIKYLKTDAYLLEDLPDANQVKHDFQFLEDQYHGYKPFELAYWPSDSNSTIWDYQVVYEVSKIHNYLDSNYNIGRMWSPIMLTKLANEMVNGSQASQFQIPTDKEYENVSKAMRYLLVRDSSVHQTTTKNFQYARIVGFIPEWGSHQTNLKNQELEHFLANNIDADKIQYRITGTTYLIDKSHHLLSHNLIMGLLIAIGIVSTILGIYFKSFKLLIISLIPNLIPLALIAGIIGWFGIDLKLTTSIIFAASFGIAVDDTIHFMAVYRAQTHQSRVHRLIQTFNHAGNAIMITSVILLGGFSIFLFSSFGATYYLGLFLFLSLTFAVIIDMTFLPIIMHHANNSRNP
ncbi:RND family transporter [Marinoscillum sp. MHG1-6]|uniref:efflux RND transporter permease subunit n=1 Tax=Marinoscillum sp. MHG1-6 TaxID=2959627 RepID=UPI0021584C86|nr:MMPL family transporter [Marinoscillum sp. MHG1-6]